MFTSECSPKVFLSLRQKKRGLPCEFCYTAGHMNLKYVEPTGVMSSPPPQLHSHVFPIFILRVCQIHEVIRMKQLLKIQPLFFQFTNKAKWTQGSAFPHLCGYWNQVLSKPCQCTEHTHKNLCVSVRGVLRYTKADWFTRHVELGNVGDLIGGGCWWQGLLVCSGCLLGFRTGEGKQGRGIQYFTTLWEGGESVESPRNTWGPLLQLQEFKEIFSQSSSEEWGVSNV